MITEKSKYVVNVNYSATTNNLPIVRKSLFRKRKLNIKSIFIFVLGYVIPCILLAWLILSWVDVICNNTSTFQYASWNLYRFLRSF